ncbi:MAG: F0F1 ATP synthase subunit delta [Candidatus Liptonbacteria bacterium]
MKYKLEVYAKVLAESIIAAKNREDEKKVLKNFMSILLANGDIKSARRIFEHTEWILAKRGRGEMVTIESARPLKPGVVEKVKKEFPKAGLVEERIIPTLVAGMRVRVNGERELDASLIAKLQKLFI